VGLEKKGVARKRDAAAVAMKDLFSNDLTYTDPGTRTGINFFK